MTKARTKLKWVQERYGAAVLVNADGRIIGEVFHPIGSSDRWHAEHNRKSLGWYLGMENAKRAVERAVPTAADIRAMKK